MSKAVCNTCHKPKANLKCGLCTEDVCKNCAQLMPDGSFSFLEKIPDELGHSIYCNVCYDAKVGEPLSNYNSIMELAKNIHVYFKTQGKETRTLKRKEAPVRVEDCGDYDEALLRLAFHAATAGFNALIDVQLNQKKLITGGYQTSRWSGHGIPTQVDPNKINMDLRNPN